MDPGGTRADIIFADTQGVKRTLKEHAKQPLFVRGREVIAFRKSARGASVSVPAVNDEQANANTASQDDPSRAREDRGDGSGVIFVSQFPYDTTQDELREALSRFGGHERIVMRMYNVCIISSNYLLSGLGPGSRYAFFIYSNDEPVERILRSHSRIPITVGGESLRIERTDYRPYIPSFGSSDIALALGKSPDSAASQAIIEELKQTVPNWRGSYEPSRVLWIGGIPQRASREALTYFWSRLGCVVEVRLCS